MITILPNLVNQEDLNTIDQLLKDIEWTEGAKTAHGSAKKRKKNQQCLAPSKSLNSINSLVLKSLKQNKTITNIVIPVDVLFPMLNKHGEGDYYGKHIDRPIRFQPMANKYFRCDTSCSVFLSDPNTYEGGELIIQHGAANHKVKLEKGSAVIYPTSYLHEVTEVTSGERICAVTWMQCAIADSGDRGIVADMFKLNNRVAVESDDPETHALAAKIYNNLVRKWSKF